MNPGCMYASYTPFLIQEEKDIDPNLLYNLLCVLKPLVDYGFYTPWNEEGKPDVRKQREENNKKMIKHFVEFSRYRGVFMSLKILLVLCGVRQYVTQVSTFQWRI